VTHIFPSDESFKSCVFLFSIKAYLTDTYQQTMVI